MLPVSANLQFVPFNQKHKYPHSPNPTKIYIFAPELKKQQQ
jgi:hypothetical protein